MLNAHDIIAKNTLLSNAQRRVLFLAVQAILCCRWRINFCSMAEVSARTERTYRRHYQEPIDFLQMHRAVVDSVLSESLSGLRVIGFDPTFLPKAGKKTPGVGRFWNGSAQRAESGLEATLTAVIDVERRIAFPLAIQQTCSPKLDPQKEQMCSDTTVSAVAVSADAVKEPWLIAEYLRHLERVKPLLHQQERHVVADSYFAKKSFLDGIERLKLFCITKLRKDAHLQYFYRGEPRAKGRGRQKVYDGKVEWNNLRTDVFERTVMDDGTVLLSAIFFHSTFKRKLKIVIIQQQHGSTIRQTILASTDLSLDALTIYRAYSARFQLEFLIRDGKGFTGLADAQTRNLNAIDTHLNISMLTLGLAKAEHYHSVGIESEKPFSMNAVKTRAFNEHFATRILSIYGLSPEMIKNHLEFQNIRNYAIIQH
ncbi:MAG: transposase [Dolichospermum sp.]